MSIPRSSSAAGGLLLALTSGCLSLELGGVVRAMPRAAAPRSESTAAAQPLDGQPLADASITLRCPNDRAPRLSLKSDADGRFRVAFPAEQSTACVLRFEKAGYRPRELRLVEVCGRGHEATCSAANANARLLPDEKP